MEPRDTLLLVDDQQADRAVLRELFQEEYNLLEAENGDQALLLLEENHTRIAAVLLDLLMPAKDGFPVLAEMRAKRVLPETPVVVITAQDSAARAARAPRILSSNRLNPAPSGGGCAIWWNSAATSGAWRSWRKSRQTRSGSPTRSW